jgi:leucyl-tRNA synthetase
VLRHFQYTLIELFPEAQRTPTGAIVIPDLKQVPMPSYNSHDIEAKWLACWNAADLYRVDLDHAQRPFYNLMEFPYPSGEGLHVGHFYSYSGADT